MTQRERPLQGKVAVVAGATRGAGRGIARGLGEAGSEFVAIRQARNDRGNGGDDQRRGRHGHCCPRGSYR